MLRLRRSKPRLNSCLRRCTTLGWPGKSVLPRRKLQASVVTKVASGGDGLAPADYRAWARAQIREAFGLPPLTTIEHQPEEPAAVSPADKVVPLTTWTPCPETALKRK
jgi:hypothetical protein